MTSNQVEERLLGFLRATCSRKLKSGESLTASTALFSSRVVDSMALVELLAFVERTFGIVLDVTMEDLKTLDTVADLARHIEGRQQALPRP